MRSKSKSPPDPQTGKPGLLDLLTGNLAKIGALLGALVLVLTNLDTLRAKFRAMSPGGAPQTVVAPTPDVAQAPAQEQPCVVFDPVNVPERIAYADWRDQHIVISGRNSCGDVLGLYVTFVHRVGNESPRLVLLRPVEEGTQGCTGAAAFGVPDCWIKQDPVPIAQGLWRWEAPLPDLAQLGELRPVETVAVTWDIRDVRQPEKRPLASSSVNIKIDTGAGLP